MLKLLLLSAACCLAALGNADARAARGAGHSTNGGMWKPKQEYVFKVEGRCLSHIPSLNKQVAGFQYRGGLLLQAANANQLLMKLENMTYAKTHTVVSGSWWDSLPDIADDDAYRELPLSAETVQIKLDAGLVRGVVVSAELQDWEVNLVQGVAGVLQADLTGSRAEGLQDLVSNSLHGRGDYVGAPVYSVFEDSVSGRCEVTYEVGRLSRMALLANPSWAARPDLCPGPGGLLEVVKTRNHSNCQHVAESHFGLQPTLRCTPADASCGDFWTRSSMTRLVGCGDRRNFLLLSASSSSRVVVNLHLHKGTEASASCFLRLNLEAARPISSPLQPPPKQYSRHISGLSYQFRGKKVKGPPRDCETAANSTAAPNATSPGVAADSHNVSTIVRRGVNLENEPVQWVTPSPDEVVVDNVEEAPEPEIEILSEPEISEKPVSLESSTAGTLFSETGESEFEITQEPEFWDVQPEAPPNKAGNSLENNPKNEQPPYYFPEDSVNVFGEFTDAPDSAETTSTTEAPTTRRHRRKKKHRSKSRSRVPDDLGEAEGSDQKEEEEREKRHHRRTREVRVTPVRHGFYSPLPRPLSPYYVSHHAGDAHACMVQQLKEVITDIASDLEAGAQVAERSTLEKMAVAIEMCRALTLPDLQRAMSGIMDVRVKDNSLVRTERKVYRDVVKLCGTSPAFHLLRTLLEAGKVQGEEAAELVAALPGAFIAPDAALVHSFYELVRSDAVQQSARLREAAVLAFSQLLRVACVDDAWRRARYPPDVLRDACAPDAAARYLPWLAQQVHDQPGLREVYLAALGNTAALAALPALKAAAQNSSYTAQERAVAVLSLRQLALRQPGAVSQLLLVIFRDYSQPLPVRLSAGTLLLFTRHGPALWHRIAVATWFEPSPAIVAFVWSSLNAIATADDPVIKDMSEWARSVLRLAKPAVLGLQLPYTSVWTSSSAGMRQLLLQQISYSPAVGGSSLYYRSASRLGGLSNNELEVEVWASDPAQLVERALQLLFPGPDPQAARPPAKGLRHSTHAIREALHIAARRLPRLDGGLRLRVGALCDRLFLLDNNIFDDLEKVVQHTTDQMPWSKDLHYQNVHQDELVMATVSELGFPVSFQLKSLLLTRFTAKAHINPAESELNVEGSALATSQMLSELGVYTGWDDVLYLAASHATSLMRLPSSHFRARVQGHVLQLFAESQDVGPKEQLLFHASSTPFTAQHDILSLAPASLSKNARADLNAPERSALTLGDVHVEYRSRERAPPLWSWVTSEAPVVGLPLMWNTLSHARIEATVARSQRLTLDLSIDLAKAANGLYTIKKVGPEGVRPTSAPHTVTTPVLTGHEQHEGTALANTTMTPATTSSTTTTTTTTTAAPSTAPTTISTTASTTTSPLTTTSTSTTTTTTTTTPVPSTQLPTTNTSTQSTATTASTSTTTTPGTTPTTTTTTSTTATPEFGSSTAAAWATLPPARVPSTLLVPNLTVTHRQPASGPTLFNATDLDPFSEEVNGSSLLYLLDKAFSNIDHGVALSVAVNASLQAYGDEAPNGYRGVATLARALDNRLVRAGVFLNSEQDSWEISATGSWEVGPLPLVDVNSMLASNLSANISADFVYQANETRYTVLVKGISSRSPTRTNRLLTQLVDDCPNARNESSGQQAAAVCARHAQAAALANRYDLTLYLNQPVLEFLEAPTDMTVARAVLEVDEHRDRVETWLRFPPRREPAYRSYALSPALRGLLLSDPAASFTDGLYSAAYCGVSGRLFHTFDGVEFHYDLGPAWHLLTKDCSGHSRVAVLARQPTNTTLEVEVNVDDYRVATLAPGVVAVDKQELKLPAGDAADVRDAADALLMRVSAGSDGAVALALPQHGLLLRYRNATLFVSASLGTRGRLCGICGDNDGENVAELSNPRGNVEKTPAAFAASYKL